MNRTPAKPKTDVLLRSRQAGSALLAALGLLAVTSVVVGLALLESQHRFRTGHQSSRWIQAAHAAEAGVELALMSAQEETWIADGWTSAPGEPGDPAVTKSFPLSTGVPATAPVSVDVKVDRLALSGTRWLRIRATGLADISGGAVAGADAQDVLLRKLSLRYDREAGTSVGVPRATRTLEILARPSSPFRRAMLLDGKFNMSGSGVIDSFDSGDVLKSTAGLYDVAKRQSNGHVGVNDTESDSDLGNCFVYGDVDYSGAAIQNTGNVQGNVSTPFSDPVRPVPVPTWTSINPTPSIINTTMTLAGGPQGSPARFKVSTLSLDGTKTLTLAPHAVGQESYVEIWVTGDFVSTAMSQIITEPGVHVTYYVEGNITATGTSFVNQSNLAANNIINAVTPTPPSLNSVTFTGNGGFIGAINAPGSEFEFSGDAHFSGAVIGRRMLITGNASVHYDEALGRTEGEGGGYRVVSWVEGIR